MTVTTTAVTTTNATVPRRWVAERLAPLASPFPTPLREAPGRFAPGVGRRWGMDFLVGAGLRATFWGAALMRLPPDRSFPPLGASPLLPSGCVRFRPCWGGGPSWSALRATPPRG